MVKVIRDAKWDGFLKQALNHYGVREPTPKCIQYANAFWRYTATRAILKKRRDTRVCKKI